MYGGELRILFVVVAAAVATSASAAAPTEVNAVQTTPGKWAPGLFTHVNVVCVQKWHCVRKPGYWDAECTDTRSESTTGVCSANGGPVDGCNACLATRPERACVTTCPGRE